MEVWVSSNDLKLDRLDGGLVSGVDRNPVIGVRVTMCSSVSGNRGCFFVKRPVLSRVGL